MQSSLSAEPALALVLCFSEVTGLFLPASSATVRPSPGSRAQKEKLEADSRLSHMTDQSQNPIFPRERASFLPTR